MVSSKSILVVAIIDSYFDRDRSINETNDGGWDSNEICVAFIGSTSKSGTN